MLVRIFKHERERERERESFMCVCVGGRGGEALPGHFKIIRGQIYIFLEKAVIQFIQYAWDEFKLYSV